MNWSSITAYFLNKQMQKLFARVRIVGVFTWNSAPRKKSSQRMDFCERLLLRIGTLLEYVWSECRWDVRLRKCCGDHFVFKCDSTLSWNWQMSSTKVQGVPAVSFLENLGKSGQSAKMSFTRCPNMLYTCYNFLTVCFERFLDVFKFGLTNSCFCVRCWTRGSYFAILEDFWPFWQATT